MEVNQAVSRDLPPIKDLEVVRLETPIVTYERHWYSGKPLLLPLENFEIFRLLCAMEKGSKRKIKDHPHTSYKPFNDLRISSRMTSQINLDK